MSEKYKWRQIPVAMALLTFACAWAEDKPRRPGNAQVIDEIRPGREAIDWAVKGDAISVRREDDQTVTEYRQKGRLYKMKVQPAKGPAYYLLDERGEGKFTRLDGPAKRVEPPMWVLAEW